MLTRITAVGADGAVVRLTGGRRPARVGVALRQCVRAIVVGVLVGGAGLVPRAAAGQWTRVPAQFYLPAAHNWTFRRLHPQADRLFNAFDYGHAILYETLWAHPDAPVDRLERREFDYLTGTLLPSPPRVPLAEAAIEPLYARMAPEAKAMFEWAHLLHRQIYDVLADGRLDDAARDAEIARLLRYYRSRPDLAFSARPKSMALMQEQWYSLAFRQRYPNFNGLIWAYHWLQVGLYEPLVVGHSAAERQAGVTAAVARFQQMLGDAPRTMPYQMPMTSVIAPRFAARYPEAAIIFDNLHSMHDVISDILANPAVPRARKRAEILLAGRRYRDDTTAVMSEADWRAMSAMMGLENMGGPSVGFLPSLPRPTVARGAVMRHAAGESRTAPAADHDGMAHEGMAHEGMAHEGMAHDGVRDSTAAGRRAGREAASEAPTRAPVRPPVRSPVPASPPRAVPERPAGGAHAGHHPDDPGSGNAGRR